MLRSPAWEKVVTCVAEVKCSALFLCSFHLTVHRARKKKVAFNLFDMACKGYVVLVHFLQLMIILGLDFGIFHP